MSNEKAAILILVSTVVVYALVAMMGWIIRTFSRALREMDRVRRAEREASSPGRQTGF